MKVFISTCFVALTIAASASVQASNSGFVGSCADGYWDREQVGGSYELIRDARELDRLVYQSTLRHEVMYAVRHFRQVTDRLFNCRPDCLQIINETRSAFTYVERDLYTAQQRYPDVYLQLLRTRSALQRMGSGSGLCLSRLQVSGRMDGRGFHFIGRSRLEINERCRDEFRNRPLYVRALTVEGSDFTEVGLTVDRACFVISGRVHY